jgi:Rrf2 family iron-sulfur cluster assembly transcriptional regulator
VNLLLTRKADYCIRAALYLARAFDTDREPVKLKEIVAEMGIPESFAPQVLAELAKQGIVVSKAGRDGGFRLARRPEEVTLLSIVEAGEGPIRTDRCVLGDGPCRWDTVCPLHETWQHTVAAVRGMLAASTLAALASIDAALEHDHVAPEDPHRHWRLERLSDHATVELPLERATKALAALETHQFVERLGGGLAGLEPHLSLAIAELLDEGRRIVIELMGPADEHVRLELSCELVSEDPERSELRAEALLRSNFTEGQPQRLVRLAMRTLARLIDEGA